MELSHKTLERVLSILESNGVSEFDYKDDKISFRVQLGGTQPTQPAPMPQTGASVMPVSASVSAPPLAVAPAATDDAEEGTGFVTSPFVGTFYRAPSPEAEPFVDVGKSVSKGQTLCIVEAMKLMNEIEAEYAGTIAEVLVDNGASVEYGQKLFKIRKA